MTLPRWPVLTIYNAKVHGAIGDGIHDDTVNLQLAIDAAYEAGGGTVYLPNGTYKVSRQSSSPAECLYAKTGVNIVGESRLGTIIKLEDTADDDANVIVTYREPRTLSFPLGFTVEEIEVAEVMTWMISVPGHDFQTGDGPFVLNTNEADLPLGLLLATNYWIVKYSEDDDHIYLALSYDKALTGEVVTISDAGTGAHTIDDGTDCARPSTDMQFRNFTIDGNKQNNSADLDRAGILVTGAARVSIRDVTIHSSTGNGVSISGGHDVLIDSCNFYDCEGSGVNQIAASYRVALNNCFMVGNFEGYPTDPYLISGQAGGGAVYSYEGDPEGAATAAVGSILLRRDGSTGTTLYVKETGSGNTGWVAFAASTPSTWRTEVAAMLSDATPSSYANGKSFIPLRQGQGDSVYGGFTCDYTGNIELIIIYAMSASNAGDVKLTCAHSEVGPGDDPSAALSAGATFTVTPGSNTDSHTLDSGDSATLEIAVTAGDDVTFSLKRETTGDTHTGDFRILRVMAKQV